MRAAQDPIWARPIDAGAEAMICIPGNPQGANRIGSVAVSRSSVEAPIRTPSSTR